MQSLQRIVWLASFPKSGNTWTRVFLANYFMPPGQAPDINTLYRFTTADIRQDFFDRVNGGPFVARDFADWLEMRPKALRAIAASKPGHHFVKTHCQVRKIGGRDLILPEVTAAAIYVMRNPFDLVLSYSRHLSEPVDQTITRMANREAVNTSGSRIFEFIGRWDEHIASWTEAPGLQRHVMRYEDMLADTERAFRGLFAFLRMPVQDGQLRRAIRAASFELAAEAGAGEGLPRAPPRHEAVLRHRPIRRLARGADPRSGRPHPYRVPADAPAALPRDARRDGRGRGQRMSGLADIRSRIDQAARAAGRDPAAVCLVAISKVQPLDRVEAVLDEGHRIFGENRVQEAAGKWPAFRGRYSGIELHLVGPLQTNKVRQALELFDVIHSVDRDRLARKLAEGFAETGRPLPCFIQVNTGEEPQKAGCLPAEADAFVARCRDEYGLPVLGLMCIPPLAEEPSLHFALLRKIAERNGLSGLSMGMSDDFERAIALGATHVRIGSAIFGARESH